MTRNAVGMFAGAGSETVEEWFDEVQLFDNDVDFPVSCLPEGVAAGGTVYLSAEIDAATTESRLAAMEALLERLRANSPTDNEIIL